LSLTTRSEKVEQVSSSRLKSTPATRVHAIPY